MTGAVSKETVQDCRGQNEKLARVSVKVSNQTELVRNCKTQKTFYFLFFAKEATPFNVCIFTTWFGVLNNLVACCKPSRFWFKLPHWHLKTSSNRHPHEKENFPLHKCSSVLIQIIRWHLMSS